ncbi:type IV pilus biogenesis protein PilM [Pinirhizobacter soli]|uniref:type IV pilus biogenesis protein PilM n=1 Tax=Pinirhizobacter soli TaxID=2786953 RepID=UPI00202AAD3E|nr:type IV pilus biogenesis protein PilM [Pinirhizobacter soli]
MFILLLASSSMQYIANARADQFEAELAATATAIHAHARLVAARARANDNLSSAVSTGDLNAAPWYVARPNIHGYIRKGRSFSYVLPDTGIPIDAVLARLARTCAHCGKKVGGNVVTITGALIAIDTPRDILEGSLVMMI